MKDEETKKHIVIDNGTSYIKAGFCGEEFPKSVFPTLTGYPKYVHINSRKKFFIGSDAESKRALLNLKSPIEHGEIKDWDEMEKIWGYVFTHELRVDETERNIFITDSPKNPKNHKKKIAQIMFELFCVSGFYVSNPGPLALFSRGVYTGISVDLGGGLCQIVPVLEGNAISKGIICLNYGGKDITEYMSKILNDPEERFKADTEKGIINEIKEKSCYVASNFEEELKNVKPFDYELPDSSHIIVKDQRIRCPEVLFKPWMLNKNGKGIVKECYDSINKCDTNLRKKLYRDILLSGGNSMFKGLPKRFTEEIKKLAPDLILKDEINVESPPERKLNVWIGGAILCSISDFESQWVTRNEYEEIGPDILDKNLL